MPQQDTALWGVSFPNTSMCLSFITPVMTDRAFQPAGEPKNFVSPWKCVPLREVYVKTSSSKLSTGHTHRIQSRNARCPFS